MWHKYKERGRDSSTFTTRSSLSRLLLSLIVFALTCVRQVKAPWGGIHWRSPDKSFCPGSLGITEECMPKGATTKEECHQRGCCYFMFRRACAAPHPYAGSVVCFSGCEHVKINRGGAESVHVEDTALTDTPPDIQFRVVGPTGLFIDEAQVRSPECEEPYLVLNGENHCPDTGEVIDVPLGIHMMNVYLDPTRRATLGFHTAAHVMDPGETEGGGGEPYTPEQAGAGVASPLSASQGSLAAGSSVANLAAAAAGLAAGAGAIQPHAVRRGRLAGSQSSLGGSQASLSGSQVHLAGGALAPRSGAAATSGRRRSRRGKDQEEGGGHETKTLLIVGCSCGGAVVLGAAAIYYWTQRKQSKYDPLSQFATDYSRNVAEGREFRSGSRSPPMRPGGRRSAY